MRADDTCRGEASASTREANEQVRMSLPFGDMQDFADARRGFVASLPETVVRGTDGRVIWDIDRYAFESIGSEAPDTVNPGLWRQSVLNTIHGLFRVTDGIYQVRGYDLSNMTIIEGRTGIIIIDPLISCEVAGGALDLYYSHRPRVPVRAVIYTHSHVDHFGGVKGVVSEQDVRKGKVRIYAPEHFLKHAVSENVMAGTAMSRRAAYMYGQLLPVGPDGQVDAALGKATSTGTVSLVVPTDYITRTGQEIEEDGVRMVFQMTPDTEAPAEMNFFFPDHNALCAAENATHNMHNILTLRGAQVRHADDWSKYLNEAIGLFGDETEIVFASHHWPMWGRARVMNYLEKQRDMYRYLNDQTLRLLNHGYTGDEIAEMLELPPSLSNEWYNRGYYGSVSHNVKAIYQRYIGWFDGNPAKLHALPPVEADRKYVEYMGGPQAVIAKAREAFGRGEYRWVAQVLNHVVFADPGNMEARELEADALEQLGYQAENATWRNFYLTGAMELRDDGGRHRAAASTASGDILEALTVEMVFDYMGVCLNGPKAFGKRILINWDFTDEGSMYAMKIENAALSYLAGRQARDADVTLRLTRADLNGILTGRETVEQGIKEGKIRISGDAKKLVELLSLMDKFDPYFNIVLP